jgi:tetratricopeptide (TPR) repeat protein
MNRRAMRFPTLALLAALGAGCVNPIDRVPEPVSSSAGATGAQAVSFLGEPLRPTEPPAEFVAEQERLLEEARARLAAAEPGSEEAADARIWVGRRLGYLGRYREAIEVFTEGVGLFPDSDLIQARFLRHRGHRWLTLREPERAEEDLERAAERIEGKPDEVEPDGLPNARGIPTSTLRTNVYYHLGLARYLQGVMGDDETFEGALEAYRECLEASKNPDMRVATSHWLYMTLRRMGRHDGENEDDEAEAVLAPIYAGLDVIENHAYHRLLLLYRGEVSPEELLAEAGEAGSLDFATAAYGIANWHLYNGREGEAEALFRRIVEAGNWPSFGHLAAEAELAGSPLQTPSLPPLAGR